jgi:hypothetical protein
MLLQKLSSISPILALTLAMPCISTGQTEPSPEWSVVTQTQIKPEFRAEYEAAQKEISAAYKKAGVSRLVVQTMLGDLEEYVSIVPLGKFAEMDGPPVMEKAMGAAPSQQLLRKISGYLLGAHRITMMALSDISIRTPGDPGEYALVMSWRLAPGKAADFTAFMKNDYLPAMHKADVANLWVNQTIFGGDPNERVLVRPMHKLAEIDAGPPARKALGAEGARLLAVKQAGIVEATHYTISRLRIDLSNLPAPEKPKTGE